MARRGRPPGTDSAKTRERIVDAARQAFSTHGFASTAVSSIAASADLAPSAVYHYFGGKDELYECVFDVTVDVIWSDVDASAHGHQTMRENAAALVAASSSLVAKHPHYSDFLALVPMEARLHPQFAHLMERRAKYQHTTFGALVDLGLATGELRNIDRSVAVEALRSLVMGSFFERYFDGGLTAVNEAGVMAAIDALIAQPAQPSR